MKPPPAAQPQQAAVADAGYQWKQVFLPEGTRLRASFGRAPYFAVVPPSRKRLRRPVPHRRKCRRRHQHKPMHSPRLRQRPGWRTWTFRRTLPATAAWIPR